MYHGTPDHAGVAPEMPAAGTPALVRSLELDGAVYASPLVVRGLTIVATENDSLYAFDGSYRQVWKRTLGSPSPAQERQCGNIDPLGITGTPIYDAGTGAVFVVAEHGGAVRHELYALDAASGAVAWSRSVDLPGVSARDMQQRGALAIAHGKVWCRTARRPATAATTRAGSSAYGWTAAAIPVYYSPPTRRGGGMWNPAGPTVNRSGNVLVVSANGAAFPGDAYDHTNSVLELDGDAKLVDSFAPKDWAENNAGDVGLGVAGCGAGRVTVGGAGRQVRPGVRAASGPPGRHRRAGQRP
jgi:hypothetical protein